jgi:hypothetical protein
VLALAIIYPPDFFLDNSRDFINFWEDSQRSRKKTTTERRTKEAIKERLLQRKKGNRDQTKEKMVKVSCELFCYPRI